MKTANQIPTVGTEWAWYARPERPNVRVHSVRQSWAGELMVRVGYTEPPNDHPASQCEFWSVTIEEFYRIFETPDAAEKRRARASLTPTP